MYSGVLFFIDISISLPPSPPSSLFIYILLLYFPYLLLQIGVGKGVFALVKCYLGRVECFLVFFSLFIFVSTYSLLFTRVFLPSTVLAWNCTWFFCPLLLISGFTAILHKFSTINLWSSMKTSQNFRHSYLFPLMWTNSYRYMMVVLNVNEKTNKNWRW